MKKLTSPEEVYKIINENKPLTNLYCTENFTWNELLLKQNEKPSIYVLNNLKKIADTLAAL
jgi:hypothetical protein